MALAELQRVMAEFIALTKKEHCVPELVVTGGEPFVRKDFIEFLTSLNTYHASLGRITILTNGSFITEKILKTLRTAMRIPLGFQISIEGQAEVNDAIRGRGTFDQIITAAERIKQAGFPIHLAATVSHNNHQDVFALADLLITYDIPLTLRRFIPIGGGGKRQPQALLAPQALRTFYRTAARLNRKYHLMNGLGVFNTNVCTGGPQELLFPNMPQRRSCGVRHRRIITIMPDGTVYPCRLLPIAIGNVRTDSLSHIYQTTYRHLADESNAKDACGTCPAFQRCHGGALCVTHALTNTLDKRDPECWHTT